MAAQRCQVTQVELHSTWVAELGRVEDSYQVSGIETCPGWALVTLEGLSKPHVPRCQLERFRFHNWRWELGIQVFKSSLGVVMSQTHWLHHLLLRDWSFCSYRIQGSVNLGRKHIDFFPFTDL